MASKLAERVSNPLKSKPHTKRIIVIEITDENKPKVLFALLLTYSFKCPSSTYLSILGAMTLRKKICRKITTKLKIIFRLYVVIHPINDSNIVFMVVQRSCSALLTVIHLKAHQLSDVVS